MFLEWKWRTKLMKSQRAVTETISSLPSQAQGLHGSRLLTEKQAFSTFSDPTIPSSIFLRGVCLLLNLQRPLNPARSQLKIDMSYLMRFWRDRRACTCHNLPTEKRPTLYSSTLVG